MSVVLRAESPGHQGFLLGTYRTGTAPPAGSVSDWMRLKGSWWAPWPLGLVINRVVFRGRWSLRVAPTGHNGPSWTMRTGTEAGADDLARAMREAIRSGRWDPDLEPPPEGSDAS
jgi:hypothetical protein